MGGMVMDGGGMPNLRKLDPADRVSQSNIAVTLKGRDREGAGFLGAQLALQDRLSEEGPGKGAPALVGAGMMGDRADVIFASPDEISGFIAPQC
jgi:cytochrome c